MEIDKKRKISVKKIVIMIVIFGIIGIGIFAFNRYNQYIHSLAYRLEQKGYNKEEITYLKESLKEENIEILLEKEYDSYLVLFLKQKYFIWKNLDSYLLYKKDHPDMELEEVVSMINVHADREWYTNPYDTDLDREYAILVNKFYRLPEDFLPEDIVTIRNWYSYEGNKIRKEVNDQFVAMYNAAKKEELALIANSSFRSFQEQEETYSSSVKAHGKAWADQYAARPGFSEHQTGLAIDIITYGADRDTFESTKEFQWLQDHAHEYGFILRYPKGKEKITGYDYESWHYRYLGTDLATKVYESGLTYDEYYAFYFEK